jgi:hypothetical protein
MIFFSRESEAENARKGEKCVKMVGVVKKTNPNIMEGEDVL